MKFNLEANKIMEALNIILSTQLVIIILLSSSVSPSSSSVLGKPPKPSPDREIFNTVMKGIIKRLASIAGKDETYTLDESTVSKLEKRFPRNKFVKELLEEVKGGNTIDEKVFFRFLQKNTGFLAKALKLCCTYNKNTGEQTVGLDGTHLKGDLSLPEKDVVRFLNNRGFLTWEEAAGRIYFLGGHEEAKSQATTGKSQKQPRTGCC